MPTFLGQNNPSNVLVSCVGVFDFQYINFFLPQCKMVSYDLPIECYRRDFFFEKINKFCLILGGQNIDFTSLYNYLQNIRKDCFQVKSNLLTDSRFTTQMNIMILN